MPAHSFDFCREFKTSLILYATLYMAEQRARLGLARHFERDARPQVASSGGPVKQLQNQAEQLRHAAREGVHQGRANAAQGSPRELVVQGG
eukprot:5400906-Pyramimonas_sp.AAC.1